jgi:hypothetical protein
MTSLSSLIRRVGYKCPATFSPADFFVYTLAVVPGHETRSRNKIRSICNQFAVSEDGAKVEDAIQAQHTSSLRLDAESSSSDSGVSASLNSSLRNTIEGHKRKTEMLRVRV